MKTWRLAGSLWSLSCSAFLVENPDYCDESGGCEMGLTQCDLARHSCVPLGSLGPPLTVSLPEAAIDLAIGDLDHRVDLKPDVVTVTQATPESVLHVLRNISE
jgi:hypothetical protein